MSGTKARNLALAAAAVDSAGNITADLIDNIDSTQFLRKDTSDTLNGDLTVFGGVTARNSDYENTLKINRNLDVAVVGAAGVKLQFGAINNGSDVYPVEIVGIVDTDGTAGWLDFNHDGSNKFKIHSSGTVSVPNGNLTVNGLITGIAGAGSSGGLKLHVNSGINISGNLMSFHTGQANGFSFNGNSTGDDGVNPLFTIGSAGDLQAKGNLTIDGFGSDKYISFRDGFSADNVGIRAKAITSANRDGLELLGYNGIDLTINNGDTVALHINGQGVSGKEGFVGIGTTSPEGSLHTVYGSVAAATVIDDQLDYSNPIIFERNDNNGKNGVIFRGSDRIGGAIEQGRVNEGTNWESYLAFLNHSTSTGGATTLTQLQEVMRLTSTSVAIGGGTVTPTGVLTVQPPAGTASLHLNTNDSANTVLYMKGANGADWWGMFTGSTGGGFTLKDETNVKDAFIARPGGAMAFPNQTRFSAFSNQSVISYGAGSQFILERARDNINNRYNPANGIFTAEVAGIYEFRFNAYPYSSGQWCAMKWNGSSLVYFIDDNNAGVTGGDHTVLCSVTANSIHHMTWTMSLQAGEGAAVAWRAGYSGNIYQSHAQFSGNLISAY